MIARRNLARLGEARFDTTAAVSLAYARRQQRWNGTEVVRTYVRAPCGVTNQTETAQLQIPA